MEKKISIVLNWHEQVYERHDQFRTELLFSSLLWHELRMISLSEHILGTDYMPSTMLMLKVYLLSLKTNSLQPPLKIDPLTPLKIPNVEFKNV